MKRSILLCLALFSTCCLLAQPSGTIVAFAGPKAPSGWLVCDGTSYPSSGLYAKLFAAIGTNWGGDAVNRFNVPDLRGMFLRGVSLSAPSLPDPDVASRSESRPELPTPGSKGDQVGSKQISSFGKHDHNFHDPGHAHLLGRGMTADTWGGQVIPSGQDIHQQTSTSPSPTGITFAEQGGNETRPVNAYVLYIIKL